jgi:holo-[acyl-carrier protein] synthase
MITGVGIDIVEINRMERWIGDEKLLKRYFHPNELNLASSRNNSAAQTLAARFAAKEAFGKALGTGLEGIVLKDIMVLSSDNRRPELHVFGTALSAFEKSGANRIHLSLTHEQENAVAMVVIESLL